MKNKPRLLVLSHVLPFPGESGQEQRIYNTLKAAGDFFHLTFLAPVNTRQIESVKKSLSRICDDSILLPSRYSPGKALRAWHFALSAIYTLHTGLKRSNYKIGRLEFSPQRLAPLFDSLNFDLVLFEYWHAASSTSVFKDKGIPCVLDIHNILWKNYISYLNSSPVFPIYWEPLLPKQWKKWAISQYRRQEEEAWKRFDGIIAMGAKEAEYVRTITGDDIPVFFVPMGVDLSIWPYSWRPEQPPRIAYYGGLSNPSNQKSAFICYEDIMPEIWRIFPEAELWLVGSNPTEPIRSLAMNPQVRVTGYIENIQELLGTMSLMVLPWPGTYGFRSRLIEVMALGVPVVTTPEVVEEMGLEDARGVVLKRTNAELASSCIDLLQNSDFIKQQSCLARAQVDEKFSFEATYKRFARELLEFVLRGKDKPHPDSNLGLRHIHQKNE